jgi:hypothetical protein
MRLFNSAPGITIGIVAREGTANVDQMRFPNSGHFIPEENPSELADAIQCI